MSRCVIQNNESVRILFDKEIEKICPEILSLKLPMPALRALIRLGVYRLSDFDKVSLNELKNAHGIGPTAMKKLEFYFGKQ